MHRAITPARGREMWLLQFFHVGATLINFTRLATAAGLTPSRPPRVYSDIKAADSHQISGRGPKGAKVRRPKGHTKVKVTEEKNYSCLCGLLKLAAPRLNCAPAGTAPRPPPANSHARDRRASKYCRRKSHAAGGKRPPQICSPD